MCTIVLGKHVQKTTPVRAVADPRFVHETMEAPPLPAGSPPSHRGAPGAVGQWQKGCLGRDVSN